VTYFFEDGSLVLKGRLPSEIGALVIKALDAAVNDAAVSIPTVRDGRVAPGNYSPGAPTEPDMQISSIRLFELRIRYATINTVHDSRGH
jgi:hypothetical protein